MPFDKSEYERNFAAAMQTKLRLNREARAKLIERTPPNDQAFNHNAADELRNSIVDAAMRDHPKLTRKTALSELRPAAELLLAWNA
jgi:hypothetical protein